MFDSLFLHEQGEPERQWDSGLKPDSVRRHGRLPVLAACWCANGWEDTWHLTNRILFAGFVVRRSRG
jgi:hypothetical protein